MNSNKFSAFIETVGLIAVTACIADEIGHRGWIGWTVAILAYFGLHTVWDERMGLRAEIEELKSEREEWS